MAMTGDIIPEHEVMAQRIIDYLDKHIRANEPLGNKMRMPAYMAEWYRDYAEASGADKVDQFFQMHLGYGHSPLIIRATFKAGGFAMEFCSPDGTRLTALEWLL